MVRIRKIALNESAKEDKMFFNFLKYVDKYTSDNNINPTSDSFINVIERLKQYYQDQDDDEIDDNDIQIIKQTVSSDRWSVLLTYKHKTYIIRLKEHNAGFTDEGFALEILLLNQNTFYSIYDSSIDNAIGLFEYFYKEFCHNYVLSNNGKFYNWDAIEKMYEDDNRKIKILSYNDSFYYDNNTVKVKRAKLPKDSYDANGVFITFPTKNDIPSNLFFRLPRIGIIYFNDVDAIIPQDVFKSLIATFTYWSSLTNRK